MDIKSKLKTFVSKPLLRMGVSVEGSGDLPASPADQASGGDETDLADLDTSTVVMERLSAVDGNYLLQLQLGDPEAERQVMDSIEPIMFQCNQPDVICYKQLLMFPSRADVNLVQAQRKRLRHQMTVVSKRVSDIILQCQPDHSRELESVMVTQEKLYQTLAVCRTARQSVQQACRFFTDGELGVLYNYRHRQNLRSVLLSLSKIRRLRQTEMRLTELLCLEDYPASIQFLQQCIRTATSYSYFSCVHQMSSRLADTLESTVEQLDVELSKLCLEFDDDLYDRLQRSYRLLGKTCMATDQMLMHFTSCVHNISAQVVADHVAERLADDAAVDGIGRRRQYHELCAMITSSQLLGCLTSLCEQSWRVMYSFHCVLRWHNCRVDSPTHADDVTPVDASTPTKPPDDSYVREKLEQGRRRLWLDIQARTRTLLLAADVLTFTFDEYIALMRVLNKLLQIGEELCETCDVADNGSSSSSGPLRQALFDQSRAFFLAYHQHRLEELSTFLVHDQWHICPVEPSFSIHSLQEFKQITRNDVPQRRDLPEESRGNDVIGNAPSSTGAVGRSYFSYYDHEHTPFDTSVADRTLDDRMNPRHTDNEEPDATLTNGTMPGYDLNPSTSVPLEVLSPAQAPGSPPVLSSTALNLLRLCARYVTMMSLLHDVSSEIVTGLTQLFDFYLYSVYSLFAQKNDVSCSLRLRLQIERIGRQLFGSSSLTPASTVPAPTSVSGSGSQPSTPSSKRTMLRPSFVPASVGLAAAAASSIAEANPHPPSAASDADTSGLAEGAGGVSAPVLDPSLDVSSLSSLYGLEVRLVAVESLAFLADQMLLLRPVLETRLDSRRRAILQQFFDQSVAVADDVRTSVYYPVTSRLINCDAILSQMANVNWEVNELCSQHSRYVDLILQDLRVFDERLKKVHAELPVPPAAYDSLWQHCVYICFHTFLEGFGAVRKCSGEGRGLMQLDFQQFIMQLEQLTSLRLVAGKRLVDNYIKAFYVPESSLDEWVTEHKEYARRHIMSLLECMHIGRKTRGRIVAILDEDSRS